MIKSRPLLTTLALFAVLASSGARANLIVFEPDDFAVGTYVSRINPLVSLSTFRSHDDTSHVPVIAPVFVADCVGRFGNCVGTTGTKVFSDGFGGIEDWGAYGRNINGGIACFRALGLNTWSPTCSGQGLDRNFNLMLMTFTRPTDFVQISSGYASSDEALLYGFDDSFNFVGNLSIAFLNRQCSIGEYCTAAVSLTSQTANIRYALAGGWANNSSLDNLQFRVPDATGVPEPGAIALLASGLVCMFLGRRRQVRAR
jgi:hypothetical protein